MPLIIEDGSIVAASNTFITESELDTYLTDRGYSVAASKEPLLIKSYSFMSTLPWCVSHSESFDVTQNMKDAQAEIAYRFSLGFDPFAVSDGSFVKREKVDVLEIEFFSPSRVNSPYSALKQIPHANALLSNLICYTGSTLLRS